MNVRDAYTHWSSSYDTDRNLTRDLDQLVTQQRLRGQHYRAILELGCGTGKNTPFYASIADRVCALDFSEGMIAQAKGKGLPPHVLFATADLTQTWPVPDAAFDLAITNLVLEHIRDLDFIFAEAHRVLATGGQFFVSELHPSRQYQGKQAAFQRDQQQTEIPAYVHHLSDFLKTAESAGFTLRRLDEWWHEADAPIPPRLVTFEFYKTP